jgi:hypothetical protein
LLALSLPTTAMGSELVRHAMRTHCLKPFWPQEGNEQVDQQANGYEATHDRCPIHPLAPPFCGFAKSLTRHDEGKHRHKEEKAADHNHKITHWLILPRLHHRFP